MARYRRRRSRRRITRRKSRRAPRRYVARKSRRSRPSVNQHAFVRSCECVVYNDLYLAPPGIPCYSSDVTIVPQPTPLSGGMNPYSSTANYAAQMTFALDKTPGYADYTGLYDQYKIKGVRVHFEYAADTGTADHGAVPLPKIVFFRDFDDVLPTTMADIMQRESQTTRRILRGHSSVLIKPRLRDYIELSPGVSSSSATYQRRWVDCNSVSVQHFGLKFALLDWPTWNTGTQEPELLARPILRIRTEYFLAFRNVR